jgi:hypothetical protein
MSVTIKGKTYGSKDQIPYELSGFAPYNATAEQNRFYTNTQKKHTGINKDHSPSVFDRLSNVGRQASNFARNVMSDFKHPLSVVNEYKRFRAKNTRGGKKKSRKSGKSRKNRKTRSRK